MTLDIDLYGKLVALAGITVEENKISETQGQPRVWYQRSEGNVDLLLSGAVALVDTTYDVEVSGQDVDATATVADALKTGLHGFRGTMGSTFVLSAFVTDHSDDYVPRSIDVDQGYHVFSFRLQIQS